MSSIIKDVEKQLDRWFAALKTGDPAQVTALYARDAILLSTLKGDVKKGHRKIRGYFEREFLPKHPVGTAVEAYTRVLGGVAVNSGLYSFKIDSKDEGRATVEARYTFVYQWTENDWKIVEHHSSLNPEG
ncbi:MAG: SgcJ/EcaC family oxidoreductase [Verrucomicrobia bacterium]|nr:SgcJ/EcaC family oxidoreductase [Verrucomicrobiota bacterium]